MKKEVFISICGVAFLIMLLVAIFNNRTVQDVSNDALHEVTTADMFKQSAYTPGANCPVGSQQYYANQGGAGQQIAMTTTQGPAIGAGQDAPVLIKIMGVEAIQVGGGKVKITGVMGSSWAEKAQLKTGDILLTFNTKEITSLEQFQTLLTKAPPEKDAKITYMRGARKKKGIIFIGEGEMEGFTPIPK
ncbi:MAG: PDZ domain-containing protein [Candidatus Omnitrophica bacterium]|nr:PDZ domain-containing protein [Candidatus Omnitrophota bacterium]